MRWISGRKFLVRNSISLTVLGIFVLLWTVFVWASVIKNNRKNKEIQTQNERTRREWVKNTNPIQLHNATVKMLRTGKADDEEFPGGTWQMKRYIHLMMVMGDSNSTSEQRLQAFLTYRGYSQNQGIVSVPEDTTLGVNKAINDAELTPSERYKKMRTYADPRYVKGYMYHEEYLMVQDILDTWAREPNHYTRGKMELPPKPVLKQPVVYSSLAQDISAIGFYIILQIIVSLLYFSRKRGEKRWALTKHPLGLIYILANLPGFSLPLIGHGIASIGKKSGEKRNLRRTAMRNEEIEKRLLEIAQEAIARDEERISLRSELARINDPYRKPPPESIEAAAEEEVNAAEEAEADEKSAAVSKRAEAPVATACDVA